MQISLKWIRELLNIETINLDTLIEKLTLGGFEVEEIKELEINKQKQTIIDISATANRSDSLSTQGLVTEISALINHPIKVLDYYTKYKNYKINLENINENINIEQNCPIFISLIIENLTNITIPKWITEKLISSGIIPLNNLVDFQNYILLETGYPFAFYDFNKISSKLNISTFNLSLSKADMNQQFYAGNKIQYELDPSILIVKANDIPISIGGIIEANEFSYEDNTNTLLIEASIFNSAKIRQQSRNLGLRTDRSARYEKSLKNSYLIESIHRLIYLLRISNPNLICKIHTVRKTKEQLIKPILLRYDTINEILGLTQKSKLEPFDVQNYLKRLNFQFLYNESKFIWEVQIPYSRSDDLTREIDLIEEIGRLHGFNNFIPTLPNVNTIGIQDLSYKTRNKITSSLLNLGFNELIHYSLVNKTTVINNEIKLINPLLINFSNLRLSLLPSLLETIQQNLKQGNSFIDGFEYGHIFSQDLNQKFIEKEYIAGIFGGLKTKLDWFDSKKALTWFEAKGKMEQLFIQLNLLTYWKKCSKTFLFKLLHPYRSAEIYTSNGISIGVFGQINPLLADKSNISADIYLFEFDFELIKTQIQTNNLTIYKEYSIYPKITKDLSFIILKDITFEKIRDLLYYNGTKFLVEINLLDKYIDQSIPKDYNSLCVQLIFQSNNRTLETKKIESIVSKLQLVLCKKFNASIRY